MAKVNPRFGSSRSHYNRSWARSLSLSVVLFFATCLVIIAYSLPYSVQTPPLYFVSIGDFGKRTLAQMRVSEQMARHVSEYNAKFVLSAGDNIYDAGVQEIGDPLFQSSFEEVYSYPSLQIPWYMTLGDHDHRGSVQAQIDYSKKSNKWRMPSAYYVHEIPLVGNSMDSSTRLQIIVTDSVGLEGLVAEDNPEDRRFWSDYNETYAGHKSGKKQYEWLKNVLKTPQPAWRIVVGHRPVFSCALRGRYPAEERFQKILKPLLEDHGVDVYLSGHDHVGQHLEVNGVTYLGNGVGGYGNHPFKRTPESKWVDGDYNGFMLHKVTPHSLEFFFIDHNGSVLHKVGLYKNVLQQKASKLNSHEHL